MDLYYLQQKAFFPPEMSSNSPTERPVLEHLKPLGVPSILERWDAILSSPEVTIQERGK